MKKLILIIVFAALSQAIEQYYENILNSTEGICGSFSCPCTRSRYRTYDGSCNNLANPRWGSANSAYARLIRSSYSDGVHAFPRSCNNKPLMNPRDISMKVSPDVFVKDSNYTLILMQWGQIVAHDMSLTAGVPQTGIDDIVCCTDGEPIPPKSEFPDSRCAPIPFPQDDFYNIPEGHTCINFVRTMSNLDKKCCLPRGKVEPLTEVTSYHDLSIVYGNSLKQANKLRTFCKGKLAYVVRNGQEWLPQASNVTFACNNLRNKQEPCYAAGDVRVNQNPQLALLQTILFRNHNRIANQLCTINPHWDDEKCYQETRRICIAEAQHITYYGLLPIFLGTEIVKKRGLVRPNNHGYVNDYNWRVNAQTLNEHATAAYRSFHTLIVGFLKRFAGNRQLIDEIRLSDWFNRPSVIEECPCGLTQGMTTQHQNEADRFFDAEVFNEFFRLPNETLGQDMHAIDIQRARDHGIGSYAEALEACGFRKPKCFDDLKEHMKPGYVNLLKRIYRSVSDVELPIGGLLETHVNGTLAGNTFLCIIAEQFSRTRMGDRYFYENGRCDTAFTLPQLNSIRKTSISRMLCDNVRGVKLMQPNAFAKISESNPLVPCDQLPKMDLNLWREDPKRN